ncbi:MAG: HlyD family type I secretion periplasmic adaptor subunit [Thiobacillus sp.]|jgi:adhesin transport system membrane fusion protein|nr:HlyD family type I secretion periplasmic adaptor subunit [Thiobacillus sp.]
MKAEFFSFISRFAESSAGWSKHTRPVLDRAFARWIPPRPDEAPNWATDADWARIDQEPLRARYLLRSIGIILLVFVLWAAFATVDEVTRGSGKVIPTSQVQIVQAVDGGVVAEILVREGQSVEAGQSLFLIDKTRFVSSLRENRVQYLALLAKAARLRALAEDAPFQLPPEVVKEDPQLVEEERNMYDARRRELEAQIAIARQQLAQRNQELVEMRSRREQAAQSYELTARELAMTKPLAASGAVSDVELLRLERDVGRYRGERDQAAAQTVRLQSAILEATRKVQEQEITFRNEMRNELAETTAKLNSLSEGSTALSDRVQHANIKSPVKGTVNRLLVTTVGGVLQPGKEIVEIVPSDDALLLEARILPKDIGFLRPGLKATVRFTAYDFAIYGGLEAVIDHIAADTVTDEDGNAFYLVRVRTLKSSFGKSMPIIPGMVAEVDILTGKKTILAYLLKPVTRAKSHAFTER